MGCPFKSFSKLFANNNGQQLLHSDNQELNLMSEIFTKHFNKHHSMYDQIKMSGLSDGDLVVAKQLSEIMLPKMDYIIEQFYSAILEIDSLKQIIEQHSTIEALKITLKNHLMDTLQFNIDESYFDKRRNIAKKHLKINLASKWYIASFSKLQTILTTIIIKELQPNEATAAINYITKLLNLEQQIVLETYEEELNLKLKNIDKNVKQTVFESVSDMTLLLAASSQQTSQSIENAEHSLYTITENAKRSSELAEQVQAQVSNGVNTVVALNTNMEHVVTENKNLINEINRLNQLSAQMMSIVEIVKQIADQTHLLSLNASVEAAHAGEAGKGFSVVAQEIRKLSNSTASSVEGISTLIESSKAVGESLNSHIQKIEQAISDAYSHVDHTKDIFNSINSEVSITKTEINHISNELISLLTILGEIRALSQNVSDSSMTLNEKAEALVQEN